MREILSWRVCVIIFLVGVSVTSSNVGAQGCRPVEDHLFYRYDPSHRFYSDAATVLNAKRTAGKLTITISVPAGGAYIALYVCAPDRGMATFRGWGSRQPIHRQLGAILQVIISSTRPWPVSGMCRKTSLHGMVVHVVDGKMSRLRVVGQFEGVAAGLSRQMAA